MPRAVRSFVPVAAAPVVAALLALALLRWPGSGPSGPDPAGGAGIVVRVVDGDTLVVDLDGREERVRLIGIDTPESVARDRPDECFGTEASHRLAELVPPGTAVRLRRDIEPRDVYDRVLAYVYRSSDDLFVNLAQVTDGYAEAKHYPPNTVHRDRFDAAEQAARRAGTGLWSVCGGPDVALVPGGPGDDGSGAAGRR